MANSATTMEELLEDTKCVESQFKIIKNGVEKFIVGELQIQFLEIEKVAIEQHKIYQIVRNHDPMSLFSGAIIDVIKQNNIKISRMNKI